MQRRNFKASFLQFIKYCEVIFLVIAPKSAIKHDKGIQICIK